MLSVIMYFFFTGLSHNNIKLDAVDLLEVFGGKQQGPTRFNLSKKEFARKMRAYSWREKPHKHTKKGQAPE